MLTIRIKSLVGSEPVKEYLFQTGEAESSFRPAQPGFVWLNLTYFLSYRRPLNPLNI
jgi:hypothetical protein